MSQQYDELPEFGEKYLQYFNPNTQSFELRRKSRNESGASLTEAIEIINKLMRRHQLSFVPNKVDKTLILLPFAFIEPKEGDQIRNIITDEIYTVAQVIKNPITKQWNGLVKLDLINPPSIEQKHALEYMNMDRYIRFDHEFPDSILNLVRANTEGIIQNPPPISPTITWSVKNVEPGGLGKPFDARKEFKPRLRESTKDPYVMGYTVEILGQWFDNIVQFDAWSNDNRTADRLIRWIEQFLKLYTGYIRQCGVINLFFWKRDAEASNTTWRQAFSVRSTQFYFRTEEIEAVYQRDILKIDITVGASTSIASQNFNDTRYIADQKISGNYTPDEYRSLFYRSGQFLFGDLDILQ